MSEQDVRQSLIDAATKLFLEKDFHNVSVRELAAEASTTSAMVNYYFKSKNGLFEEMIKYQCELIQQQVMDHIGESSATDYAGLMAAFQMLYANNPNLAKFEVRSFMEESAFGNKYLQYMFQQERQLLLHTVREAEADFKPANPRTDIEVEAARIMMVCCIVMGGVMEPALKKYYGDEDYVKFKEAFSEACGSMAHHYLFNK